MSLSNKGKKTRSSVQCEWTQLYPVTEVKIKKHAQSARRARETIVERTKRDRHPRVLSKEDRKRKSEMKTEMREDRNMQA